MTASRKNNRGAATASLDELDSGGRRWTAAQVVPAAAAYAVLSWLAAAFRYHGGDARALGWMAWPMWNLPRAFIVSAVAFGLVWLVLYRRGRQSMSPPAALLCLATMVAATVLAYLVYRHYVGHLAPVADRATALQYGFEELMAGRNPYYRHTQLGNTISPMLGGIILAGPFVLANGTLYWQGMVWLVLGMAFLTVVAGWRAGAAFGALLTLSPTLRVELPMQSDGWVNGVALAVIGTGLYLLAARHRRSGAWTAAYVGMSLLFALAFSYRFIYAVLALPLVVLLWRHFGRRTMLTAAIPAAIASALLTFMPYLADPSVYAPFAKASLGTTSHTVADLPLITAIACVLTTVAGTLVMRTIAGVWGTMAAVGMVFVTLTGWGQHDWFQYLTYAYNGALVAFLLFALLLPRWVSSADPAAARPLWTTWWPRTGASTVLTAGE